MAVRRFGDLRLAFFDIDGTLLRRDYNGMLSVKQRAFNHAAVAVFGIEGADYTKVLGKQLYGLTDKLILKTFLEKCGISESQYYFREADLFEAIDDYFSNNHNGSDDEGYYPLHGAPELLQCFAGEEIRLGLVTGNICKHSQWKLEPSGLLDYFTTGGYGDDGETRIEIMRTAISRNPDIMISAICHFGDSPADLEAARECNIKAVAITNEGGGTHSKDELAAIDYGLVIDSWTDINAISRYLLNPT